jgi:hypothetical protein
MDPDPAPNQDPSLSQKGVQRTEIMLAKYILTQNIKKFNFQD